MHYRTEITINKPLEQVTKLIADPNNLRFWQPGLEKYESISGNQGEEGSKSKLTIRENERTVELEETVIKKNLPKEYIVSYQGGGVFNKVKSEFSKLDDNTTRYVSDNEFRFNNPLLRIASVFMADRFRQSCDDLLMRFKTFAESGS